MLKKLFKSEDIRRDVNPNFDTSPTYGHIFNFEISKEFIKNKKVLDIGCWTGQYELLALNVAKKIVGLDPNPQAIAFARKKLKGVKFSIGKAEKLSFPDSSFNTVVMFQVIEHVSRGSEERVLQEIKRVLKSGGTLILSTDNNNLLAILFDPAYFLIGHRHYSMKTISDMLIKNGFKIIQKRMAGNMWGLIYSISSLFFKHLFGIEPKYSSKSQEFLLKEHQKKGFTHLYIIAKSSK